MKNYNTATRENILYDVLFAVFVAVFAGLILYSPQLAPTDDFVFLKTLQAGKFLLYYSDSFPYYDSIELGRFTPAGATEYNFFGIFSDSPDPFWYFSFHALEAILFSIIFVYLIRKFTDDYRIIYGLTALIMLSPGFAITMFRLQLNERNLILLFAIFALLYWAHIKKPQIKTALWLIVLANTIIYYKETAFLAIGAFAFTRLILFWKTSERAVKKLDLALFSSSALYLILYFFIVYQNSNLLYLGTAPIHLTDYIKRFINYAFFTDSIIYLVLLPIFFIRCYQVFIKKFNADPKTDPLLAGATAYSLVYLAVGYGPYYLLPAYGLTIPAIFMHFKNYGKISARWKAVFIFVALTTILNTIPLGAHYIAYHKYLMWNFNSTLDFLTSSISKKPQGQRQNIFLYGTGRESGKGTYGVLADFMIYRGLTADQFDLKSDVKALPGPLYIGKTTPPFSIFENSEAHEIKNGDYLIVSPQSKEFVNKNTIEELKKNYTLIFNTESKYFIPNINMKSLAKYLLIKNNSTGKSLIENQNAFTTPDYYIFVKN